MFNSKIKNYLDRLVNSKSCPRAYIFAGQGGNEKEEAVFYFISRIAVKADNVEFINRVKAKNHPDVVIIEPEIEEKKGKTREKEIGIPQIREALERIKFFPYELKKKFCVIKKAQKMNVEAANALLKHFEEPAESAAFILLADETESILPTIVSRCAVIRFPQTELPKWDEENRAQFKKMFQQEIFERFDYIEKISKNKNEMIAELKDWELVAAEGLRKLIKKSEDRKKIEKVVDLIENIKEAIARLEYTNASARAVGEELVLNF